MEKQIRMVLAVKAVKLADLLEAVDKIGVDYTISVDDGGVADDDDSEIDRKVAATNAARRRAETEDDEVPVRRGRAVKRGGDRGAVATRGNVANFNGRRVLYTPAGSKREIGKLLESLKGEKTLRAYVLTTIAKRGEMSNAELRKRAEAAGFNPESVDNVIWTAVKRGLLDKRAE